MAAPKSPFAVSLIIHAITALALFTMVSIHVSKPPFRQRPVPLIGPLLFPRMLKTPSGDAGGGGGGGSPFPAGVGQRPKQAPRPYAPPMIIDEPHKALLLVEPALLTENTNDLRLPQWGDLTSKFLLASNGPGYKGGLGRGDGGGIGDKTGPGSGPGSSNSGGSSRSSPRSGVTPPQVTYQVDPEFSEEARRAKHYGSVILVVDVDTSGHAVNIRIAKSLGLGLDEKAVEAISRWRFRPGRKDGRPIVLPATIEVNFHLL